MPLQFTDLMLVERAGTLYRTTAGGVAALSGGAAALAGSEPEIAVLDYNSRTALVRSASNPAINYAGLPQGLGTFARASEATFVGANGLVQTAASGVLPYQHDPLNYRGGAALMEASRTNLATNAGNVALDSLVAGTVVSAAAAGPSGTPTMGKFIPNTTSTSHFFQKIMFGLTDGAIYTGSRFFKADGYRKIRFQLIAGATGSVQVLIDLIDGTITPENSTGTGVYSGSRIVHYGGGIFRAELTGQIPGVTQIFLRALVLDDAGVQAFAGDGVKGVLTDGAQFEAGLGASAYIPTTTAAVTRAAALQTIPSSLLGFGAAEGTMILKGRKTHFHSTGAVHGHMEFRGANTGNRVLMWSWAGNVDALSTYLYSSGELIIPTQVGVDGSGIGQTFAYAISWSTINGTLRNAQNGAVLNTNTGLTIPDMSGGDWRLGAISQMGIEIDHAILIGRSLSNDELIERTSL